MSNKNKFTLKLLKDGKWQLAMNGHGNVKRRLAIAYNWLERKLAATAKTTPTSVRVVYLDGDNETIESTDYKYLLYSTACFLEDFFTEKQGAMLQKKYGGAI